MKKVWIILPAILVILITVMVFSSLEKKESPKGEVQQENVSPKKEFTVQTDDQREVSVSVKPVNLEAGKEAIFEVTFETHSVPLDFDLAKIAKLTDDSGNTYQPVSWTGGTGGHHLSGNLSFPKISKAKSVELLIPGVANIDRKFKFPLDI